jgi:uncharacterized membrane protein
VEKKSGGRIQRLLLAVLGVIVIVVGIMLLFLPGPGILLILAGLWILGRGYQWPQKVAGLLRERGREKNRPAGRRSTV